MAFVEPTDLPHLDRVPHDQVRQLEAALLAQQSTIEYWFRRQWRHTRPPLYASVDLRNAGFKLTPVDTNLFPAGFNNLAPGCHALCVQAMRQAIERSCPTASRVLIIPESHTRNPYYLDSLGTLASLVSQAGFEVRIGSLRPDLNAPEPLGTTIAPHLQLEPLTRNGARLGVRNFDPCLILLNNDLSGGMPPILDGLEQNVLPPTALGWTHRSKQHHFALYAEVADEFAAQLGLDPWLITPDSRYCGQVDFQKREGLDCLTANGQALFDHIRARYAERDIDHPPFLIVKADAGTYGMGVMSIRSIEELTQINRKTRSKMSSAKEGLPISRVLLQEGIPTAETWGVEAAVAEPVVYMIDATVVGGFYRVHAQRGPTENLNAPGMEFHPLPFCEPCICPDLNREPDAGPNRFYTYGVIARLALLAAAREMAEIKA